MTETIKLYDQDAYQTEFDAEVVSCEKMEKNGETSYQVILNQTLFFPEEGGQSADQGFLGDSAVLDVQIKKNVITHTLTAPLQPGEKVHGNVDWKHRFSNMQQHTGEHIFSGIVHKKYGYDNVGFHLSDQIVTMDFSGKLTEDQIAEIEQEVNEAIIKNIETVVSFPSKEELKTMEYRSKIEIEGQVRIVTVPGYDQCACCAPHVKKTGEIGMLKVTGLQNYKSGVRISILCGFRALEDYRSKTAQISRMSVMFSVKPEQVADTVEKLKTDSGKIKQELSSARQELLLQKIAHIPESQESLCLFEKDADQGAMRAVVNAWTKKHAGICGVFVGTDETGYRYIAGIAKGDARILGNQLKEKFQARGGGSAEMIQGSLSATAAEIKDLF